MTRYLVQFRFKKPPKSESDYVADLSFFVHAEGPLVAQDRALRMLTALNSELVALLSGYSIL